MICAALALVKSSPQHRVETAGNGSLPLRAHLSERCSQCALTGGEDETQEDETMSVDTVTALTGMAAVIAVIFGFAALLLAASVFSNLLARFCRKRQADSHTHAEGIQR